MVARLIRSGLIVCSPVPLWYRLSNQARKALAQYQWDTYGYYLEIPSYPVDCSSIIVERFMSEKPKHPKRVV